MVPCKVEECRVEGCRVVEWDTKEEQLGMRLGEVHLGMQLVVTSSDTDRRVHSTVCHIHLR